MNNRSIQGPPNSPGGSEIPWTTISSARPYDIAVDPQTLVATYTIDYVTTSGRSTTQQGRLQLQRDGEGYLIAGEG